MAVNLVDVAADLRRRARQGEPAVSTSEIIRTCFPGTLVTGRVLPPGVQEAVSRTSEGNVLIYARGLSTPEQRFAIAHGMAHLLFDTEESACRPGTVGVPRVEARADRFADELLVPLFMLAPFVARIPDSDPDRQEFFLDHVDEISSKFKVPSAVIERRIRKLIKLVRFDWWKRLA